MTKICPNCGIEYKDEAEFCKKCGGTLSNQEQIDKNSNESTTDKKEEIVSNEKSKEKDIDAFSTEKAKSSIFKSEPQSDSKRNIIIIAIVAILCIASVSAVIIYLNGELGLFESGDPIHIIETSFTTEHTLSAKTICIINFGLDHSGENVSINIVYSRDGTDLNSGDEYTESIGANGTVVCESKEAYELYPDHAIIKVSDSEGNLLDSADISLNTDDSTQLAEGNGTVKAKSITSAEHSAS